jgi:diadenosine tetraphosphate (Ap4A) HIT family hydrolase
MIFKETNNFYIALAKGPIVDEHFLIIPKKHIAHTLELENELEDEYEALKNKLLDFICNKKMSQITQQMDYILFERNVPFKFDKAAHMNV